MLRARWLIGAVAVLVCAFVLSQGAARTARAEEPATTPAVDTQGKPAQAPEEGNAPEPGVPAGKRPVRYFRLVADNWSWTPDVIRVKRGTHVVLKLYAYRATRSFDLKAYKLKVSMPQEQEITAEFDADTPGTFPWRCGRPCGDGCAKMRGTLIVDAD